MHDTLFQNTFPEPQRSINVRATKFTQSKAHDFFLQTDIKQITVRDRHTLKVNNIENLTYFVFCLSIILSALWSFPLLIFFWLCRTECPMTENKLLILHVGKNVFGCHLSFSAIMKKPYADFWPWRVCKRNWFHFYHSGEKGGVIRIHNGRQPWETYVSLLHIA